MAKDMEAVINAAIDNAIDDGSLAEGEGEETTEVGEETTETTETGESTDDATGEVDDDTSSKGKETETKTEEIDALMDEFIKDGFKPRKGAQPKENKIPYSNVQKIIGNREARAIEAVAKSLGVDAKTLKFDGLEAAISEKLSSYRDLESRAENFDRAEEVMTNDADRYIRILATVEPQKYGKFLKVLDNPLETKETNPDDEILKEMPDMDVTFKLADGSDAQTYSPQALQKMFVTAVKLGEKRAATRAEGLVKPLKDERETEARARQRETELKAELEAASQWHGMDRFHEDVLKALQEDTKQAMRNGRVDRSKMKYKSIRDAYIAIVPAKLAEEANVNEQKVRQKLIEEAKKSPKSTSVDAQGSTPRNKKSSGDPVIDAIERSLERAGL